MKFKYQLAIMGPGPIAYKQALGRAVGQAVRKLELNPTDFEVVTSIAAIGKRNSIVGVWLASISTARLSPNILRRRGWVISAILRFFVCQL